MASQPGSCEGAGGRFRHGRGGQESWLRAYFERQGDYYFIIETLGGIAVGAYGIYDVAGASAESGRWIIRPDVPAAIPSAMQAFEIAFEKLGLRELRVKTVSTNRSVLSLNRKFGFRQTRVEPGRSSDRRHSRLTWCTSCSKPRIGRRSVKGSCLWRGWRKDKCRNGSRRSGKDRS